MLLPERGSVSDMRRQARRMTICQVSLPCLKKLYGKASPDYSPKVQQFSDAADNFVNHVV